MLSFWPWARKLPAVPLSQGKGAPAWWTSLCASFRQREGSEAIWWVILLPLTRLLPFWLHCGDNCTTPGSSGFGHDAAAEYHSTCFKGHAQWLLLDVICQHLLAPHVNYCAGVHGRLQDELHQQICTEINRDAMRSRKNLIWLKNLLNTGLL